MTDLADTLDKVQKLHDLLVETPEVMTFLTLLRETGSACLVAPVRADRLIEAKEAAQVLKVSRNKIGEYTRQGLLAAYYTPGSSSRKYWLRDVLALPRKEQ